VPFVVAAILGIVFAQVARASANELSAAGLPYELIVAGMLIMAAGREGKPLNYDELERWTRVDYERGMRTCNGER